MEGVIHAFLAVCYIAFILWGFALAWDLWADKRARDNGCTCEIMFDMGYWRLRDDCPYHKEK